MYLYAGSEGICYTATRARKRALPEAPVEKREKKAARSISMSDKYYRRLVVLYGVYFLALGASSYTSIFLSGRGMDNAQIGLLMSVAPLTALIAQPIWGLAGDRAKYKRTVLAIAFFGAGAMALLYDRVQGFWPLLAIMCAYNVFSQALNPAAQTLSIEYSASTRQGFGPIRMSGSITYQLIALALGFILTGSMQGLYRIMGAIFLFCGAYSFLMPPIPGHQHKSKRVSPLLLLRDKRIVLILAMTFFGKTASMFYMSFYSKYVQELFGSNSIMSTLTFLSVVMEIPFLFFSKRFMKKLNVTQWILLGLGVNAVRFISIAFTKSLPMMILLQLPAVSVMACFEFYPSLYMNSIAPKELLGSVQSLNVIATFGMTQLTGTLIGGYLANALGLQATFGVYGAMLVVALLVFLPISKRANLQYPE